MAENEQTNLAAVLRLAEGGWRLFPCSARDKRPLTPQGFHDATTDTAQLVKWAERHPGCLWATPDALVLDVDTHDGGADGYAAYRALADEHGGDGGAVAVPTRSGGLHLFYRNPDDSIGRRPGVRPGLDLLGRDGYKVLWHPDKLPALANLPDPPPWVVGLSKPTNGDGAVPSIEYDNGEAIPYGQRHAVFVRFAGRLRRMGLGADSIEAAMLDTLLPRCQPERPDTRAHMRRVASSVASRYDAADLFDALHLEDLNPGDLDADEAPAAESSWLRFVDVSTFDGLPRPAPEVAGLFYLGHRNLVSGESEAGKTWLVIVAAVAEIMEGRDVLWIDTDGMGEHAILERLRAFGASLEAIRAHFRYVVPTDRLTPAVVEVLTSSLAGRLVACDSFNATMSLHGWDFNKGPDVESFYQRLADPFCRAGYAFVVLDHVTKSAEGRGQYSIGSERKHSGAYLHLGVQVVKGQLIVREGVGRSSLATNKDRGAYFDRPTAGIFTVGMSNGSGRWGVLPVEDHGSDTFRPTALMERVSRFLEMSNASGTFPAKSAVEDGVHGKAVYVLQALDVLVAEGYVRRYQDGAATRHGVLRPYVEADDPQADVLLPNSSLAGRTTPGHTAAGNSSPPPPPYGEEVPAELERLSGSPPDSEADYDARRADW